MLKSLISKIWNQWARVEYKNVGLTINQGGVGIRMPDQGSVGRSGRQALKNGIGRSIRHSELVGV